MKAYTFIHSYVCGIQVGIQAGHAIVELMRQNPPVDSMDDGLVQRWANSYKTFVWLDGGDSDNMNGIIDAMRKSGMPCAYFNEPAMKCSAADVNDAGMVTATTIVLTAEQVKICDMIRYHNLDYDTNWCEETDQLVGLLTNYEDIGFDVPVHMLSIYMKIATARRKSL